MRGVVFAQVMRVVGDYQRDSGFLREPVDQGHDDAVLIEVMILHFQEEVVLPEHVGVLVGEAAGFLVAIGEQGLVDVASEARRKRNQALGVTREQFLVDAGLVVEAFQAGRRDQLDEIAVALLVLAEQDQVVIAIGVRFDRVALLGDVDLAADDRMNVLLLGLVVELHCAEQVAVIGHGDGRHLLLGDDVHELADFAGAVEQRVVGMAMKMNEWSIRHRRSHPAAGSPR